MAIDRSSIIRGPAVVQFRGQTFYFKGDLKLAMRLATTDLKVSAFGKVDERVTDRLVKITGTPSGVWAAGPLGVLYPYASAPMGLSLFGAADQPLVIQTLAGTRLLWRAGAVTKMPSIVASAAQTLLGAVEFTCVGANNTPWATAGSMELTSSAGFSDMSFNESGIVTAPYTGSWGTASPWANFQTRDGFRVEFTVEIDPVVTDADGTVDLTLRGVGARVTCVPVGVSEADVIAALVLQGTGAGRGASLTALGQALVISSGGSPGITLASAALKTAGLGFGTATVRAGECLFAATRTFAGGVPNPLFALT